MAREIVECVPNFSEGRRKDVVDAISAAIASVSGVRLLDVEMDANHNRAVVTFIGDRKAVAEAAFRGAAKAVESIDLTKHRGEHPRIGALDVCPFIPLAGQTWSSYLASLDRQHRSNFRRRLANLTERFDMRVECPRTEKERRKDALRAAYHGRAYACLRERAEDLYATSAAAAAGSALANPHS